MPYLLTNTEDKERFVILKQADVFLYLKDREFREKIQIEFIPFWEPSPTADPEPEFREKLQVIKLEPLSNEAPNT